MDASQRIRGLDSHARRYMEPGQLNWIANFIWGIADDVLRDLYVRGKYRDVILPMTVLRRLDAVLEPTKQAVLAVALAHHLVSKYTSLVAVDVTPARPTDNSTIELEQKREDLASVANLPKTATSGQMRIVLGILAIMLTSLMWSYRKRIA